MMGTLVVKGLSVNLPLIYTGMFSISVNSNVSFILPSLLAFHIPLTHSIAFHIPLTNQIADFLHFNDKVVVIAR